MPFSISNNIIVNSTTTSFQEAPSITALTGGGYVVVWRSDDRTVGQDTDETGIRARIYTASGAPVGADFLVNQDTDDVQMAPVVTALDNGGFTVLWQSLGAGGGDTILNSIQRRSFTSAGAGGTEITVNSTFTGGQTAAAVTRLNDGRLLAVWQSDDGTGADTGLSIRGRYMTGAGSPTGSDFLINTTVADDQITPTVTALSGGRAIVMWQSFDDDGSDTAISCIRGRIVNANGNFAGDDFVVNSVTDGGQGLPDVAMLDDGRFIATWVSGDDAGPDTDVTSIRARIFAANGTPAGGDFTVNTTFDFGQSAPSVAALADGRFIIVWESNDRVGSDMSGECIRARIFLSDGTAAGKDYVINATATDTQELSDVTVLANGRIVITWQSDDTGDGSQGCIRSARINPDLFVGDAGRDNWKGGSTAERMTGNGGKDAFAGNAGNDTLMGNAGADTLSGGAGADRFIYLKAGDGGDRIIAFAGPDTFAFEGSAFGFGNFSGNLAVGRFLARADNHAQDGNDRFIFRTTDDTLWFDRNGSAAGGVMKIADLSNNFALHASDIVIL
jgi:RTX calcium-binding nonapeptide repeat (4 copies)